MPVKNDNRGQAVIELVLVLPLFLTLLFSILTLGYWMNAQQVVTTAAREGAVIGASTNDNTQIQAAVMSVMDGLDSNPDKITVFVDPLDSTSRVRGTPIKVKVQYAIPLVYDALPAYFKTVSAESTSRMENIP